MTDLACSLMERSIASVVQLLLKRFEASDFLKGLLVRTLPQLHGLTIEPPEVSPTSFLCE